MLVRLRLIGGRVSATSLRALVDVAEQYGDGHVHVTSRANLQVRSLPGSDGRLHPRALAAIEDTGLLPTRTHELVRNVLVSPRSGLVGGRTDLRHVATELDTVLCAHVGLARLPGRFRFVLDDGSGDLLERSCDLGLVALDADTAQLRVGSGWGPTVPLADAASRLAALAELFLDTRGSGPTAPWHVDELAHPLIPAHAPDPRLPAPIEALPFGQVPGGRHVEVPSAGLDRGAVEAFTDNANEVIVTPWRGVLVPEEN